MRRRTTDGAKSDISDVEKPPGAGEGQTTMTNKTYTDFLIETRRAVQKDLVKARGSLDEAIGCLDEAINDPQLGVAVAGMCAAKAAKTIAETLAKLFGYHDGP
jgi:hypothetical protein